MITVGVCLLAAGVPLTVNAFGFAYRAAFQVLSFALGGLALTEPRVLHSVRDVTATQRLVFAPLVALWLWGGVRAPWSLDRSAALGQLLDRTALIVLLFVVAGTTLSRGRRRAVLAAGLLGMAGVAAWGVLQAVGIHPFIDRQLWRPSWPTRPLGTHNLMGGYVLAWLPIVVGWFLIARRGWRVLLWGMSLLGWLCLVQTESRGAWLAGCATTLVGAVWAAGGGWRPVVAQVRRARWATATLGLAMLVVVVVAGSAIVERVRTPTHVVTGAPPSATMPALPPAGDFAGVERDHGAAGAAGGVTALSSIERRQLIAEGAFELIRRRPWVGYGAGSFRLAYYTAKPPLMQRLEAVTGETAVHAHWDALEIAVELGVPGLLAALIGVGAGLAYGWRRVWRDARRAEPPADADSRRPADADDGPAAGAGAELLVEVGIVLGLFGMSVHALVDFDFHEVPTALVATTLLGLVASGNAASRVVSGDAASRVASGDAASRVAAARGWRVRAVVWAVLVAATVGSVLVAAAEAEYRRAYRVLTGGDLEGAERHLDRAQTLAPGRATLEVALAEVALHRARRQPTLATKRAALEQAARHFERAAALEPAVAQHALRAAATWMEAAVAGSEGGSAAAAEWALEAARRNPYLEPAQLMRARLRREAGDLDGATEALDAAERNRAAATASPSYRVERARLALARADTAGALAYLQEAAAAVADRETVGLLGELARAGGAAGEAARRSLAERVATRSAAAEMAALELADVAAAAGDLESAERWLREAGGDESTPAVLVRRGHLALRRGRLDEATRFYRRVLQTEVNADAIEGLGRVALARRDTAGAIRFFERAVAGEPRKYELRALVSRLGSRD